MRLTLCDHDSPRPVVVDHLDVAIVHVAEEDAVSAGRRLAVVEGQRHHVLKERRVLQRLHGRVEVVFVREMNALKDGPLRVEQVAVVALAGEAISRKAPVGAGAGPATAAQVEAQLLAAAVAPGAWVCAWRERGKKKEKKNQTHVAITVASQRFLDRPVAGGSNLHVTVHCRWKSAKRRSVTGCDRHAGC